MPTYEYRCRECGHELEAVQAFTDDPLTTCPACGAETLRKVFGSVGISFKGSGFYKTDSRGSSSTSPSTSSTSSESSSSDSGTSSTGGSGDSSSATTSSSSEAKTA
ncbi:MAG: FmdB family zinc ribbon protein [Acidimicrobiia bacterium]